MSSRATNTAPVAYCTKCGNPLESGARFCAACGAPVESAEPPTIAASKANGEDAFEEALVLALEKDSSIPAMPLFQKALALGLAPKTEVQARLCLGEGYREIVGNSGLSAQQMVKAHEFGQCMVEIEKAFELDRAGSLNFFSDPLNIGRLRNLDLIYLLATRAKKEQDGTEAAISYLARKLQAVDYLVRPPLLASLVELGELYQDTGCFTEAARCARMVLDTSPLYPADQEWNDRWRGHARQLLSETKEQPQGSSGASRAVGTSKPQTVSQNASGSSATLSGKPLAQEDTAESDQETLAITLYNESLDRCEHDPTDGSPLFTSIEQIRRVREQLTRALALKFHNAQLRSQLEVTIESVNTMEQRKFVGSWFLVIVWGLFYVIPGFVCWAAYRRPRYLINRDYLDHLRTGKHKGLGARVGGIVGRVYDFCEKISPDWGWIFGLVIWVILSPLFVLLAFKENYLDIKKEESSANSGLQ